MSGRVRWGIVGCGWIARDYVAPAIRESRNGDLVAACDPSADARAAVGASSSFESAEAMLSEPAVDAVYVATPNHLHKAGVLAAARAGKHVLCEKPTATNADDAAEMAAACDDAGVLLATAYDQRFHAAHMTLREHIERGDLGTVTTVLIRYACWTGRDWKPGEWEHDNWRVDPKRAGGGAMIDLAPHGLDLAQMLIGERIEDVHCLLQRRVHTDVPVDDGGVIIGRTTGGVLIDLSVAYNCPETFPRRRLEVVGTKAMAVAEDTMGQTPGGTLTLISAHNGEPRQVDFSARDRSPFLNQIEAFADAVLGESEWPYPADRDVHTMRLLDICGQRAALPWHGHLAHDPAEPENRHRAAPDHGQDARATAGGAA